MMLNINRRRFCQFLAASTGLTITSNWSFASASPLRKLTIGGSPIIITVLLAYVSEQPQIQSLAQEVDFRIWKTHDQLRADAVSRKLQISATPTTLAAGLYQKGLNIKLLNVLVWGVLNLWSWDQTISSWTDLLGKRILIAFRGGLPSQYFTYLAGKNGIDVEKDLTIQYTTDFTEAVQLLLAKRGDVALLAEPAGTVAQVQGENQGIPIQLVINLQNEWSKATGRQPRIPQAGTLALNSIINEHPEIIRAVQTELKNAVDWALQDPKAAAELGQKYLGINANIIERSLLITPLAMISASEAKEDLEFWFSRLMEQNPRLFDGKLPEASFYF